jgi:hypothetical protein
MIYSDDPFAVGRPENDIKRAEAKRVFHSEGGGVQVGHAHHLVEGVVVDTSTSSLEGAARWLRTDCIVLYLVTKYPMREVKECCNVNVQ